MGEPGCAAVVADVADQLRQRIKRSSASLTVTCFALGPAPDKAAPNGRIAT